MLEGTTAHRSRCILLLKSIYLGTCSSRVLGFHHIHMCSNWKRSSCFHATLMRSTIPKHQFYLSNCILAKLYCLAHTLKISKYLHKYKKNCVLAAIAFLSTHILASKPSICCMLPCCIFSLTLSHIFVAIAALLLVPPALAHCSWGGSYNSARFVSNAVIFYVLFYISQFCAG